MIVVDANVLVYSVTESDQASAAAKLRARDASWVAPPLVVTEVASALAAFLRRGRLSRDECLRSYRRALSLVKINAERPDPVELFQLIGLGLSAYDASYVLVARSLGLTLVTADQEILRLCPDVSVGLAVYAK